MSDNKGRSRPLRHSMDCVHVKRAFLAFVLTVCNKIAVTENNESHTTESDDVMKCAMGLNERIPCAAHGTSDVICSKRGCCYDSVYKMCYFPEGCRVLTSVVGGSSFYYVLPGRDDPRGRMALPSGHGWCARDLGTVSQEVILEMSLAKQFSIVFMAEHHVDHTFVFPFLLNYRNISGLFTKLHAQPDLSLGNTLTKILGGVHKFFWERVEGDGVKIQPFYTNPASESCTHLTIVTCPTAQPSTVTSPMTQNMTTVNEAIIEVSNYSIEVAIVKVITSEIKESSYYTKADERPSAIFIGSFGIIVLSVLIAVFILIDIPSYQKNFAYMRKNIRILRANLRKQRKHGYKPARMSDVNSTPNRMPKRKSIEVTQTSLCISDS